MIQGFGLTIMTSAAIKMVTSLISEPDDDRQRCRLCACQRQTTMTNNRKADDNTVARTRIGTVNRPQRMTSKYKDGTTSE